MAHPQHLVENNFFRQLAGKFPRSPRQINHLLEGDAEIICLENGAILALTTDSIVEEIATGLYSDPRHIGWMTVAVNLSDLAAVGAEPLGILLSHSLPPGFSEEKLEALQTGIAEACEAMGVYVLGGDTNQSPHWQMGGTAIGILKPGPVITRKGAQPGDGLYISGDMGIGNAYAFNIFLGGKQAVDYRPLPRLKEGQLVRLFGSSCIDTSDGFFPAVCNLMEINEIGVTITVPFDEMAHPAVMRATKESQLPEWFFLAGPHGEFELVFTISKKKEAAFLEKAGEMDWHPLRIGTVTEGRDFILQISPEKEQHIDAFQIANLFAESDGDPRVYLSKLVQIHESWKQH